jgi:hypothetical protein
MLRAVCVVLIGTTASCCPIVEAVAQDRLTPIPAEDALSARSIPWFARIAISPVGRHVAYVLTDPAGRSMGNRGRGVARGSRGTRRAAGVRDLTHHLLKRRELLLPYPNPEFNWVNAAVFTTPAELDHLVAVLTSIIRKGIP